MGMPSSKAACLEQIARLQGNIAQDQAGLGNINLSPGTKQMYKARIASNKAEIAKLRAHMKTLKN